MSFFAPPPLQTAADLWRHHWSWFEEEETKARGLGGVLSHPVFWFVCLFSLMFWSLFTHLRADQPVNTAASAVVSANPVLPPVEKTRDVAVMAVDALTFGQNVRLAFARLAAQGVEPNQIIITSNTNSTDFWQPQNLLNPDGYTGVAPLSLPADAFEGNKRSSWQRVDNIMTLSGLSAPLCEEINRASGNSGGIISLPNLSANLPEVQALCVKLPEQGRTFLQKLP
jgi:hypothetical protein